MRLECTPVKVSNYWSNLYLYSDMSPYQVLIIAYCITLSASNLWPRTLLYQVFIMAHCTTQLGFYLWSNMKLYQVLIYGLLCCFIRSLFVAQYVTLLCLYYVLLYCSLRFLFWPVILLYQLVICGPICCSISSLFATQFVALLGLYYGLLCNLILF